MNLRIHCMLGLAASAALLGDAIAQTSTVEKVRTTRGITIGYRETVAPMSYNDSDGRTIGYSIDVCSKIVEELKLATGLATLEVRYLPIQPALRTALLINGTIDMECSLTANTVQREQQVDFTLTTFITYSGLVWKKGSGIKGFSDLKGRRVAAASGILPLQIFNGINSQRKLGAIVVPTKTSPEAFALLAGGNVDACLLSDTDAIYQSLIHSIRDQIELDDEKILIVPSAIALRKSDPEFKELANRAILKMFKSREIYDIYRKWFESPLPPRGVNMQMPMNQTFKRIILTPTDSPDTYLYR